MEKSNYLLTKLKSYRDQNGSLLDNSIVLFGSGMGHSDNHTAQRIPIILAGNGGGRIKTGRYIRYSKNQELSSLHLSLLNTFGIETDSYSASSSALPGLDGGHFNEHRERPFNSWVKHQAGVITAQGRLRMSDNLDEARVFYLDVEGLQSVRIEIEFRDFHDFNLAYHVGTPITLTGNGSTVVSQSRDLTADCDATKPYESIGIEHSKKRILREYIEETTTSMIAIYHL